MCSKLGGGRDEELDVLRRQGVLLEQKCVDGKVRQPQILLSVPLLLTETQVEIGTFQSKSGTSLNFRFKWIPNLQGFFLRLHPGRINLLRLSWTGRGSSRVVMLGV